ncbi:hypothetical protein HXX02_17225 [Microbulbifer elongatus]|uniref:Uncharacterized protein n=1 Tax=Microbulbifer elongatus TaxID=86173 RepID=A0ABT1P4Z2_9GAMM|nr:hypothetical protein [Microbulbifer elongatus]MCQ3831176.1 hypothetical protein [Microbulbifer elongatus]
MEATVTEAEVELQESRNGRSDRPEDSSRKSSNDSEERVFSFSNLRRIHREAREQIRLGVIEQLREHGIEDAHEKVIENIVDDITGNVQKREFRNSFLSRLRIATLFAMVLVLSMAMLLLSELDGQFVSKLELKQSIEQAVENKASLNELKIVFFEKSKPANDILGPLIKSSEYYSKDKLSLQMVLEELKVDLLTLKQEEYENKATLKLLLDKVLEDYLRVNPFEGLDDNDKKDLNNLSAKLSIENYSLIKPEIDGLTESLKVKNSLIREYLSSSNMSLYISLAAFIFSILIAVWQFLPNAKASQKQLISDAIREHIRDLNSNKQKQSDA